VCAATAAAARNSSTSRRLADVAPAIPCSPPASTASIQRHSGRRDHQGGEGQDLFKTITVKPAVDFGSVEEVIVLHTLQDPGRGGEVLALRWLRFAIGLIIALTLHSLLDSFFPTP